MGRSLNPTLGARSSVVMITIIIAKKEPTVNTHKKPKPHLRKCVDGVLYSVSNVLS